ncbi:MAG: ATP-binding cassette domain-containing protein [Candidatus Nanoarchaeia archaeon]|nr:ATP-binding cassette domain-containing protein [Candidatus Nanoarchaeia archaeon]
MQKENIIEVRGLKKTFKKYERGAGLKSALKSVFKRKYKTVEAVKDISFSVKKGEILGYLGPNGAGKSTVIKMLTGVLYPEKGEIRCLNYAPWDEREKYVKNIGVVFGQKSSLWWELPPVDTYKLYKEMYEISDYKFNKNLKYMIKLLDIKDVSKTPVLKLSLGQRMRCEFISSVLHEPKILFLDEPTIGLDIFAKEKIRQFIKKINREKGTTVILTTHDISDVEELCDRIIIIDKGEHIFEGTIQELKNKYVCEKKIYVEFDEKPGRIKLSDCRVIRYDAWSADVFVDLKKRKVKEVVSELFRKYYISDITISEESVENIIKRIYLEAEKK